MLRWQRAHKGRPMAQYYELNDIPDLIPSQRDGRQSATVITAAFYTMLFYVKSGPTETIYDCLYLVYWIITVT